MILVSSKDQSDSCRNFLNKFFKGKQIFCLNPEFGREIEEMEKMDVVFLNIVDCFRSRFMNDLNMLSGALGVGITSFDGDSIRFKNLFALAELSYCGWYWYRAHWSEDEGKMMYWAWAYAIEMKWGVRNKEAEKRIRDYFEKVNRR
jgi:hypothetical protein